MSKSVGNQLKAAREAKGIGLGEASEALFIRTTYLQALENGRGEIIPSPVQTRGFLRMYADYLGLDSSALLRDWDSPNEASKAEPRETRSEAAPKPIVPLPPFPAVSPADEKKPTKQPDMPIPQNSGTPYYVNVPQQPAAAQLPPFPPAQSRQDQKNDTDFSKPQQESAPERKPLFGRKKNNSSEKPQADDGDPIREIFIDIGKKLQTRRQALGLTIEDCETQTVIRGMYLQLMESGDLDQLPSFIQARGMLNNYASFLNADVDAVMLKFADALQLMSQQKALGALAKSSKNKDKPKKPTKKAGKLQQFLTPDLFVGIFVIIAMIAVILYCIQTIASYRRNLVLTPTIDLSERFISQNERETVTPAYLPTPTMTIDPFSLILSTASEETEEPENRSNAPIQLFISANQRTYLKVVVDGREAFAGRTLPNNTYPFDAQTRIEVTTGNADALSFNYNQQELGKLGSLGEVLHLYFTGDAVITPTPQFSPTPTATYQPTYTPRPESPMATLTPTPYIP